MKLVRILLTINKKERKNKMNINLPNISKGTTVPYGILEKEAKEKELRKQQWRHDFRVALFSVIAGGISGIITSIILLKVQGIL